MMGTVYRANLLDPESDFILNHIPDGLISVTEKGIIDWVGPTSEAPDELQNKAITLEDSKGLIALVPAFCDLHFHWVQDLVSDMPKNHLLEWLEQYVFPEENRFESQDHAKSRAEVFFQKLLKCGTLSGAIYGSIHEHSITQAMRRCIGDFRMGNVVMTENCPPYLKQSAEDYQLTCLDLLQKFGQNLIVTPRFALSCDPQTLKWLGHFSRQNNLFVQTHQSETLFEIEQTLSFHRKFDQDEIAQTYLEIYDRAGLIHDKTILGHCIHMNEQEINLMALRRAKVAHCPSSNAPIENRGLGSGLFDYRRMDSVGIEWALASDIGAGPYLSMLDVMKSFLEQNRSRGVDPGVKRALYRSTVAGNSILGFSKKGRIQRGYIADFVGLSRGGTERPERFLEEVFERDRQCLNELPVNVIHRGKLKISKRGS